VKTRTKCGIAKPLAEFPPVRRGAPALQTWCRSCFAEANAANYRRNHDREKTRLIGQVNARRALAQKNIVEYLTRHPCNDCGERDIVVLDFDHRGRKLGDVSTFANSGRSWARVFAEILKCDVRCANCHRRETARRAAERRKARAPRRPGRMARQLDLASAFTTRTCRVCGESKALAEFPFRSIGSRTHQRICLACQRSAANAWYRRRVGRPVRSQRPRGTASRERLMAIVFDHLVRHACVDCGESDPMVLDFDHRSGKVANVSDLVALRASPEEVLAEIAKCDVRCANHHRRRTAKTVGAYRLRA
jgi:histone H3/H4